MLAIERNKSDETAVEPISDEDLAERARADSAAMAVLYRRYFTRISAYVGRRITSRHEAEDVTAQTFLAMVRGLPKWRRTAVPVVAWLYRLATNEIVNWSRRQRLRRFFGLTVDPTSPATSASDDTEELRLALLETPEPFQTALALHYLEQLSIENIAAALNVAHGTVKSRLSRGRELLRQRLESRR